MFARIKRRASFVCSSFGAGLIVFGLMVSLVQVAIAQSEATGSCKVTKTGGCNTSTCTGVCCGSLCTCKSKC